MKRITPEVLTSPRFCLKLVVVGVLLRLVHLLENRSLWLDEAYLALNVLESSFQQLLHHQHIIREQARAPLLFSLAVKGATCLFGSAETVLRLVPFLCGAAAVYLFYRLARRVADGYAATLALTLFVFCDRLIYYAAELKPYAGDVFVTVGLLLLYGRVRAAPMERGRYITLAVAGLATIWFSYPGIIVLAAVGLITFWQTPRQTRPFCFLIGCLWLLNVGMVYKFAVRPMLSSSYITGSIAVYFPPAPVWTAAGWRWWAQAASGIFADPLGQSVPLMSAILLTAGAVALWRRDRSWCAVLGLPVLMTIAAAGMGKYPFHGRHLLFLTPVLLLFIACGAGMITRASGRVSMPVAILLAGLLIVQPMAEAVRSAFYGREHEDNRAVMQLVTEGYRPGDGIYLNTAAQYMFAYYLDRSGREADFLQPLPVGTAQGFQGLLIGKIAIDNPEFSYEILVYDRDGRMTGKSFVGRADLGVIRDWTQVAGPHENRVPQNWLILSHVKDDVKTAVLQGLRGKVEYGPKVSGAGAQARFFRWTDY